MDDEQGPSKSDKVKASSKRVKKTSSPPSKKQNQKPRDSVELLHDKPLYTDNISIEDMDKNNKSFYERTSKKAFNTALKEEKIHLNELVDAEYYPEEEEEVFSDVDLMKNHLNLIS
jgi:hypothetical protein